MVVLTRWKSPVESDTSGVPSREFVQPRRRRRRRCESLDLCFSYFAIVAKKLRCASETCAELRRWPYTNGGSNGGAGKNLGTYGRIWVPTNCLLGTYGFAFGYLRILLLGTYWFCFWVPTDLFLGTYGFSFGYLLIRTASRETCGRDQVPNTSLLPAAVRSGVRHYPFLRISIHSPSFFGCHLEGGRILGRPIGTKTGGMKWPRKEGRKGLPLTRAPIFARGPGRAGSGVNVNLQTDRGGCRWDIRTEILLPVFRQTGRDQDFPFFLLCMLLHVPPSLPNWNFASFGKCSIAFSAPQEFVFFSLIWEGRVLGFGRGKGRWEGSEVLKLKGGGC
jgi:hypothetical protein